VKNPARRSAVVDQIKGQELAKLTILEKEKINDNKETL
jgi:hypothetical protein